MKRQETAPQSCALDLSSIAKRNEEAGSSLPKTSAEMSDIEESPKSDHSGEEAFKGLSTVIKPDPEVDSVKLLDHGFNGLTQVNPGKQNEEEGNRPPVSAHPSAFIDCCARPPPSTAKRMETVGKPVEDQQVTKYDQVSQLSFDINKLLKRSSGEMDLLHSFSDQCCIYRVPIRLRELNEKIFTPQVVSLGPLHHGKEELKAMEEQKILCLQDFLEWSNASLDRLIKVVEEKESRLRNCYTETINLDGEKFVKMMLLDAAFIIAVLLRGCPGENFVRSNDRIFYNRSMLGDIMLDMCLLENQLPFFILEDLSRESGTDKEPVMKLTCEFVKNIWASSEVTESDDKKNNFKPIAHIVDLMRKFQEPSETKLKTESKDKKNKFKKIEVPSVTELHQAGVKFSSKQGKSLLDMEFEKRVLEMPTLRIDDYTETIFRNLQAFEQCHCEEDYIGNYISMINFLVITPNDVEILVRNGIIENWIHDNEAAANLLHKVSKGNKLCPNHFIFDDLHGRLKAHCTRPWNKWKATLKQQYFHTPWGIISFIAAVTLLILTAIQTTCSIISV